MKHISEYEQVSFNKGYLWCSTKVATMVSAIAEKCMLVAVYQMPLGYYFSVGWDADGKCFHKECLGYDRPS